MVNSPRRVLLCAVGLLLAHAASAVAQTTTYHLHATTSGDFCCRALTTSGPAPTGSFLQTGDLKNQTSGATPFQFQTPAGTGLGGTIPSGSVVSFSLWMRKTANWGVIVPQAVLQLNGTTAVCSAVGTGQIVQSPSAPLTFQCAPLAAGIPQATTDKLRLLVGYAFTTPPGNHSVKVELDFDGSTDSQATVPNPVPPQITSISPVSGPVNWTVTVAGTNFGPTQGTSTVTFGGVPALAADTTWGNTSIATKVPAGASTGAVVVTVRGAQNTCPGSNCTFTVIPPPSLASAVPTSGQRGDTVTIAGANFLASQGSSTVKFGTSQAQAADTTWSNTSIVTKVPASATAGPIVVTVSGQASNALTFSVIIPGTIAGTITKASDSTALQGATVQAVLTGVIKGTATSAANGTYSLPNLLPGTYDVRVLATGYSSEVRSQALANNSSSTVNVAMSRPGSIAGQVTAGGTTPLPGAALTMFLNGIQKGAGNSDASGNYSIAGLHPGSYTLQVVDVGYRTKEQGVVINDNAATTANVSLDVAPAGPVSYAYDALGRLVSVVDASGDAATYTYDAVGNILSIGRVGAGTVAITQVTPNSGLVGAPVTVYGTGFSATPGQNTVTFFNNKPALVTSSTATQIVTTVPANATSGTIAVTSPLGSATSSSFTVNATTGAPTISGFTPAVALAGTALIVSGTNFDTTAANDQVTVNQTFASPSSASATSLGFPLPAGATSGPISVSTLYGTAVSATDLIVPPSGYAAVDIELVTRIGFGDPAALTVPVNTSGKIAIVLFDGIAGRRASFKLSDIAYPLGVLTVITPYNVQLASSGFTSSGLFLDTAVLPVSGTYTIIVKPSFTYSGSVRLTVYDVPPDVTGPIVPGGATVTANLATPGQNARYTFTGSVNQRVALSIGAGPAGTAAILSPEGLVLGQSVTTGTTAVFFDTITLTKAGIYAAFGNPTGANTGSLALTLYNAADITTSITPGGASVNVATSIPGQRVVASFTATAGQRVSLKVTNVALSAGLGCKGTVSLVDSSNTTLRTYGCLLTGFDSFLDVTDPLAAGGYTAVFDPAVDYTGSATLTLYDVTDLSATLGVNDPSPTTVSFTTPGQNAALTFSGTSGQLVTVTASGNTFPPTACVTVRLFRQDGTTQLATATSCSASFALAQQTLPATENYIVRIDPAGSSTGSVGIRVTNP